ncbi:MAG: hypothetical protein BWY78_00861 [Alphaproteobacteria bacterium ADurb.Bin438]|nr:MAG: hypothetical protein BWY78_00861 [Alphaproteobacteria bacterium ADurb.Bin438]
MKLDKNDAISLCAFLFDKVKNITELKAQIDLMNLKDPLGSDGLLTVIDYYQQHALNKFKDEDLIKEIMFWAEGGSYKTHLDGFNAFSPKALITNAKKRNWIIKELPNKILISPENYPPIAINPNLLIG